MKKEGLGKVMLQLGGSLFIITAVVALVLGLVDSATRDKIEDIKKQAIETAMQEVSGDGAEFEKVELSGQTEVILEANKILRNGTEDGYCVQVAPNGFGGAINMIVGISAENKVLGVKIVSMSETPGLGSNAENPEWIAQFKDTSSPLSVVKTPGTENQILALSGATITSKGVTSGVQAALDFAEAQN